MFFCSRVVSMIVSWIWTPSVNIQLFGSRQGTSMDPSNALQLWGKYLDVEGGMNVEETTILSRDICFDWYRGLQFDIITFYIVRNNRLNCQDVKRIVRILQSDLDFVVIGLVGLSDLTLVEVWKFRIVFL